MISDIRAETARLLSLAGDRHADAHAAALSLRFPSLHALLTASAEELTEAGLSPHLAVFLCLVLPIDRRRRMEEYLTCGDLFCTAEKIGKMFCDILRELPEEMLMLAAFDNERRLLLLAPLSHGTVNEAPLVLRKMAEATVNSGAAAVAVAHNHPSGNAAPSDADRMITCEMQKCLSHLGVPLLEHFVVAKDACCPILLRVGKREDFSTDPAAFYSERMRQDAGIVF